MTLTRPTAGASDATGPSPCSGIGKAVAVLVLVTLGALIPLLGPSAALHGTGEAAAPGVVGIALLRAVLFAALCVPVGELFVNRLARTLPGAPPAAPRSWAPYAAAAGFVAALGLASVVATGNLVPHGLAEIDIGGLYESRDGKLALLEVNAFLVAGLCARSARPATQVWPLTAVVVAEALRAHPTTEQSPLVGSGLTLVHLTCAALWVGGLLYALRTLRRWGPTEAGAALLGLYARVAVVLLAVITATGVCSTLRRMPPGTVLHQLTATAYGRVLLAKVLLVAVVAALALWARFRLRRAPDPLTACSPARAEVVALGVVVVVSGLLTALPVPIRW
ncbi:MULTISPECIES: CopD family protein [unclassified Streptomyces]|uniref:CopD family protein n=1 Tax=unclassified Streptomyces TaxID=2593676 RepID=UPI002258709A|nr:MULTISPECIES: CopD family protein [unclassified Streptomyces]MCX5335175.1 CopD family protein [Streptomyces sp. NBC_00140]MCX5364671.1 CopD family protein [Streptomyces sp. NBC_00124]